MDVSNPCSSVIPSLDGVVLAALAGTNAPMNLTSVHDLAGKGSLSGVRRVLMRLVSTGIVLEVPGGYLLNRDHAKGPRTTACTAAQGRSRLQQADAFVTTAELVLDDDAVSAPNVARLLAAKDESHYGVTLVDRTKARRLIGYAQRITDHATQLLAN